MTDQRPPTLQTIADAVGVSRTTVSNAYNRPEQLTAELRQRIMDVAEQLGYSGPDPSARSLRTGTSEAVGLVFAGSLSDALSEPTAMAFMRGVADAGQDAELGLLLLPAPIHEDTAATAIRNAKVDGFILYSVAADNPALAAVLDRRLPIVIADEPDLGADAAFIGIDDRGGARAAAQHLLELGHTRFGVLAYRLRSDGYRGLVDRSRRDQASSRVARGRFAGYAEALEAAGIDWDSVPIVEAGGNTPQASRAAAAELLSLDPPPTAVLGLNDNMALAALLEAAGRGWDVPGDLSVVGFDDVPRASVSNPPLTTVRQPLFEKGRAALRVLENAAGNLRVELPIEFIARGSTGAPRTPTESQKDHS